VFRRKPSPSTFTLLVLVVIAEAETEVALAPTRHLKPIEDFIAITWKKIAA
jgi:hypothetical protein